MFQQQYQPQQPQAYTQPQQQAYPQQPMQPIYQQQTNYQQPQIDPFRDLDREIELKKQREQQFAYQQPHQMQQPNYQQPSYEPMPRPKFLQPDPSVVYHPIPNQQPKPLPELRLNDDIQQSKEEGIQQYDVPPVPPANYYQEPINLPEQPIQQQQAYANEGNKFICDVCGRECSGVFGLQSHKRLKHPVVK
jgi:hypothetical protein